MPGTKIHIYYVTCIKMAIKKLIGKKYNSSNNNNNGGCTSVSLNTSIFPSYERFLRISHFLIYCQRY